MALARPHLNGTRISGCIFLSYPLLLHFFIFYTALVRPLLLPQTDVVIASPTNPLSSRHLFFLLCPIEYQKPSQLSPTHTSLFLPSLPIPHSPSKQQITATSVHVLSFVVPEEENMILLVFAIDKHTSIRKLLSQHIMSLLCNNTSLAKTYSVTVSFPVHVSSQGK